MKRSTIEKYLLLSPILVNILFPYAMMNLDARSESYTLYSLVALLFIVIFPILPGVLLTSKPALALYFLLHLATAIYAIFIIYNDSALIYLYVSLLVFALTVAITMLFRKKLP